MRRIGDAVSTVEVVLAVVLMGFLLAPRPATAQVSQDREVLNVLLAGNSQLWSNNLGDILAGIAAADPLGPIIVPTMTGGATLQDHLEGGARRLLESDREWDYVIMQEVALLPGNVEPRVVPISPEPEREFQMGSVEEFHKSVRALVGLARAKGAKTILFPSPPRRLARFDSDVHQVWKDIKNAHLAIAGELGGDVQVAPISDAFEETRQRLISVDTYMYDLSHPSAEGSYLEALVIYAMITGRDPSGAPALIYGRPIIYELYNGRAWQDRLHVNNDLRVPLVDLPLATALELQKIAWQIVSRIDRIPISAK